MIWDREKLAIERTRCKVQLRKLLPKIKQLKRQAINKGLGANEFDIILVNLIYSEL